MTLNNGGWTVLLHANTPRSADDWTSNNIENRNENTPGLLSPFSILYRGDSIKATARYRPFFEVRSKCGYALFDILAFTEGGVVTCVATDGCLSPIFD